ncbi:MAG: phytoene/squalene synthase family protein [Rhodoluna sp.]|nr:phytoene/squalene synthase family protein [Rhodoluna sp.]
MSSENPSTEPSSLERYLEAAERSSAEVIDTYSTSFGWASKLLGGSEQQPVRNIYALVRVADEIVDGAAAEAQDNPAKLLDELEAETYRALASGFSTNLVVHAFAHTAREAGIKRDIIEPFFHSMRMDLTEREHDQKSFDTYVYGSAEVVGLMCLKVFMVGRDYTKEERVTLIAGARALGAAFQKVNFLRDLAADFKKLGRSYFPNVNVESFDQATQLRLIEDIENDLATSAKTLPLLPRGSRKAVAAAQMFFQALNERIRNTPAEVLIETRISVPNSQKLVILTKALLGVIPK